MSTLDHTPLARLRPEKFDDAAVAEQISLIRRQCEDVDYDTIAMVFHECNQNMQQTLERLRARDFEDGEWQQAKPNNKKKNHLTNNQHPTDQIVNGNPVDNGERSLSQRTSPTSSLRDGYRRNERYQYPPSGRPYMPRRGNDFNRNHFHTFNPRYPPRSYPNNKFIPGMKSSEPFQSEPSDIPSPPDQPTDKTSSETASAAADHYEPANDDSHPSSFDSTAKKTTTRRPTAAIPIKPVSMHRTINFPSEPLDIQFGDVQWNDSVPITVTPSDSTPVSTSFDHAGQESSARATIDEHEQRLDTDDGRPTNRRGTNESDIQFLETASELLSSSANTDNVPIHNSSTAAAAGTSHLSDHLTGSSSSMPVHSSAQASGTVQIPITRLPPTSTPRAPEYTSPTTQFVPHTVPQTNPTTTPSPFASLNNAVHYSPMPRDFNPSVNWNPSSANYKGNPKASAYQPGTYPQQSTFQFAGQQQQPSVYYGAYPYPTGPQTVLQVLTPIDSWANASFQQPLETYPYAPNNYLPAYHSQQQYHQPSTKFEQHAYDKDFFANYGHTRSSSNDALYQQQQSAAATQPPKDTPIASKLSPTAAAFPPGAQLTASASATALYMNPVAYPMPNYLSVGGSPHQERFVSYSPADTRDNRNGASYGISTNRSNYHHYGQQQQAQQRAHHNNASNSTWHSQQ